MDSTESVVRVRRRWSEALSASAPAVAVMSAVVWHATWISAGNRLWRSPVATRVYRGPNSTHLIADLSTALVGARPGRLTLILRVTKPKLGCPSCLGGSCGTVHRSTDALDIWECRGEIRLYKGLTAAIVIQAGTFDSSQTRVVD